MNPETHPDIITLEICGGSVTLGPWELMRWIVQKTILQGQTLYARGECAATPINGKLLPHSVDRTQRELTRSLLVDILTDNGTYTINCKHLTLIYTNP